MQSAYPAFRELGTSDLCLVRPKPPWPRPSCPLIPTHNMPRPKVGPEGSRICPECGCENSHVVRIRRLVDGTKRRRLCCQACGAKWTMYESADAESWVQPPTNLASGALGFSDDDIKTILLSTDSTQALASRYNCSTQSIRNIVLGKSYKHVHTSIRRENEEPGCHRCHYWNSDKSKCSFGFPEAVTEFEFAQDCHLYEPAKRGTAQTAKSNR